MSHLLVYTLEASIVLIILFVVYRLLFRKNTFHTFNRFMLILIVFLTLVLPALRISVGASDLSASVFQNIGVTANKYLGHTSGLLGEITTSFPVFNKNHNHFNWRSAVAVSYCLVLVYFLCRLFFQLYLLYRFIKRGKRKQSKYYSIVYVEDDLPPFSFFRWIILNPAKYTAGQLRHITTHEKVHVKHFHSLDILFADLFTAFFWFHPIAWKLKESIKLNLEYIADAELLQSGVDRKEYQYSLLNIGFNKSATAAVNYFNHSHIKKRIAMMNNETSPSVALIKYLIFIPIILFITIILSSFNASNNGNAVKAQTSADSGINIYLAIREDMTKDRLEELRNYLSAEGVDIKFSGLNFNQQHLLTQIRLVANEHGRLIGDITASNDSKALSDPIILYVIRKGEQKEGVTLGYPKEMSEKDIKILKTLNGLLKYNPASKDFEVHGSVVLDN